MAGVALMAAAGVIAVALTGGLPPTITQLAHLGRPAGTSAETSAAATQRADGGASRVAPDRPVTSASAPARGPASAAPRATSGPAALCREYFSRLGSGNRAVLRRRLAARAGSGQVTIGGYCRPYLKDQSGSARRHPTRVPLAGDMRPAAGAHRTAPLSSTTIITTTVTVTGAAGGQAG